MKIICGEEHAIDPAIDKATRPAVLAEAPYAGLNNSANLPPRPRDDHRPTEMAMPEALELGADLGGSRIKNMDAAGI